VTLATILLKLWKLRFWVAIGLLLAVSAAAASEKLANSTVYSSASTQMLVDSPSSALANSRTDLAGYIARANVFASLMTSDEALQYIGRASGIPGNLIDVNGPVGVNGAAGATHAAVRIGDGKNLPASPRYKLSLTQNPDLPTVDVYADAPTTGQAVALADGAVTGLAQFVQALDGTNVPPAKRIEIRKLGDATGSVVDPGAGKKITVIVFVAVFAIWCVLVLFVARLLSDLRAARRDDDDPLTHPAPESFAGEQRTEFVLSEHGPVAVNGDSAAQHSLKGASRDDRVTGDWSPRPRDSAEYRNQHVPDVEEGDPRRDEIGLRP
jgi:hypothetical protein